MIAPTPSQPRRFSTHILHPIVFCAFVICAGVLLCSLAGVSFLQRATPALEALFLGLAFATTVIAQTRTLPFQNVFSAVAIIIVITCVLELVAAKTGLPFGARAYPESLGLKLFGGVPWIVPLIWVVALLNSRGVARLILRPWRKTSRYGFRVIGLACLLAVIFDINLEPFASRLNSWWIWSAPESAPDWHSAPPGNFLGWAVVSLLVLAFITPWLINKGAVRHPPPDYHSLAVWLLLNLVPITASAMNHYWLSALVGLISCGIVTMFAIRGARW